ncbi:hypothetical protein PR048_032891 [Dryococelus australis]|uniref:Uncharacterized protein n=1 Tax=Dryococelus australis TaxID=614101 RepID=A0ABQ9G7M0_9NEOP|nr:hypothetical protein PR048_032891 [Dryococelus australis]
MFDTYDLAAARGPVFPAGWRESIPCGAPVRPAMALVRCVANPLSARPSTKDCYGRYSDPSLMVHRCTSYVKLLPVFQTRGNPVAESHWSTLRTPHLSSIPRTPRAGLVLNTNCVWCVCVFRGRKLFPPRRRCDVILHRCNGADNTSLICPGGYLQGQGRQNFCPLECRTLRLFVFLPARRIWSGVEIRVAGKRVGPREGPPTNGIVRYDSHLRESGDPAGNRNLNTNPRHLLASGREPRPSYHDRPMRYPLQHDDSTRATVNISVSKECFFHPSSHLAVETMLKTCTRRKPTWMIDVSVEQRRNEGAGEAGYLRENPPTDDIVRHDSHLRKSGGLTAQPPRPLQSWRPAGSSQAVSICMACYLVPVMLPAQLSGWARLRHAARAGGVKALLRAEESGKLFSFMAASSFLLRPRLRSPSDAAPAVNGRSFVSRKANTCEPSRGLTHVIRRIHAKPTAVSSAQPNPIFLGVILGHLYIGRAQLVYWQDMELELYSITLVTSYFSEALLQFYFQATYPSTTCDRDIFVREKCWRALQLYFSEVSQLLFSVVFRRRSIATSSRHVHCHDYLELKVCSRSRLPLLDSILCITDTCLGASTQPKTITGLGEPSSNPARVAPEYLHVEIVTDDAACRYLRSLSSEAVQLRKWICFEPQEEGIEFSKNRTCRFKRMRDHRLPLSEQLTNVHLNKWGVDVLERRPFVLFEYAYVEAVGRLGVFLDSRHRFTRTSVLTMYHTCVTSRHTLTDLSGRDNSRNVRRCLLGASCDVCSHASQSLSSRGVENSVARR